MMDAIDVIAILFLRISLILLIFALVNVTAFKADSFIVKPDKEVYGREGSDVTLEWQFHVGSRRPGSPTKISEFLFGEWMPPGYIRNKILAVQKQSVVLKRRGFEKKVDWSGNIRLGCVNCTGKVKMYNLTAADFKTYGVEVELSLDRSPLTNWLKLEKLVPAEIILWKGRNVEEGKATTIECKATGRPTPFVIIKKKNQNLCKNTGHCVYDISAANKSVHEGEYLCLVQQRNYSSQIRRSLNLTVLEKRRIPPTKNITDSQTKNSLMLVSIAITCGSAIVIVCLSLLFNRFIVCIKHRHNSGSKEDQQRRESIDEKQPALNPTLKGENENELKAKSVESSREKDDTVQVLMHHN